MSIALFSRTRFLGFAGAFVLALVLAPAALADDSTPPPPPPPPVPAAATGVTSVDTSACTDPELSQAFLGLDSRDSNWYMLPAGETDGSFDGTGWTLSGGASIATTDLADGSAGSALDLPSGASAVSPDICVTNDYPNARALVHNVAGGEGIQFFVSYAGTPTWLKPKGAGTLKAQKSAWTLASPVSLQPQKADGWQIVRFAFVGGGKGSEFQLYNFYVDPRMKG